ncbi:MAG TPA: SulP family inorganic anion transporter [Pirellulaceae bacterium]|jgi:MFS superfamily sulfate permease-like transporter|nr:SulP family inorganic anion transporter [Pirellulaceae bacterium]
MNNSRFAVGGFGEYVRKMFATPGRDFLASIVVFLVALPLCMGIAIASGVPVSAGLITGIVGGLVVGFLAGAPLQVSGPAAGLTVIVYELVREHGLEMLGIAVLLGGLFQFVAGLFKLGQWFRAVSPAVIQGMLAGIGVLIVASQFHVMVDDKPKENAIQNIATIPQAIWKGLPLPTLESEEVRRTKIALLKEFGALHESQVQIREFVEEEVDVVSGAIGPLDGLADRQRVLADRLQELQTETTELLERQPGLNQSGRFQTALAASLGASTAALAALESPESENAARRLVETQAAADASLRTNLDSLKDHAWAAKIGLLAIGIIVIWHLAAPKSIKLLPGALIAVAATTALAAIVSLPVLYVEVPNNLWSEIHIPTLNTLGSLPWIDAIQLGLVLAIVASAETLLCATAVDRLQSETKTNYDQELAAQGVGNMICGVLGALPMTGVIVRSATNVQAGAKSRLSAILHGVWLLILVSFLAFMLRLIPIAALAAILVYTGYKLVNVKAIKELYKHGWWEVVVYFATMITIVVEDLLIGVVTGIVLSALRLLFVFSRLNIRLEFREQENIAILHLAGSATFLRLPILADKLEQVPPGSTLLVDLDELDHIDHACLDLLKNWSSSHEKTGGKMVINWESVHDAFNNKKKGKNGRTGDSESDAPEDAAPLAEVAKN